jgi:hypothetical protein
MADAAVERFDFEKEVEKLVEKDLLLDAKNTHGIVICGGEFTAAELSAFLNACNFSRMKHRILEYADHLTFGDSAAKEVEIEDVELFERARVFSVGGDLSLRRDGGRFLWHFIGTDVQAVPSGYGRRDFWNENRNAQLRQRDESALLWGEHRGQHNGKEYWHDDRVGWAALNYPHAPAKRIEISYTVFTEGGQVAFVWWKELRAYGQRKNQIAQK